LLDVARGSARLGAADDGSLFDAPLEFSPGEAMDSTSPLASDGVDRFMIRDKAVFKSKEDPR
jgi:hypothetical protein